MSLKIFIVLTCLSTSGAMMGEKTSRVQEASNDVQEGVAAGEKLLPKFRESFKGKPEKEAAAAESTLKAGRIQMSDGINSLHKLSEELQSSLAEVQAAEKAEIAAVGGLAKKVDDPEILEVQKKAQTVLDGLAKKKEGAKLKVRQGSQDAIVGEYEARDALSQKKVDTTLWHAAANETTLAAWEAVFPQATKMLLDKKDPTKTKNTAWGVPAQLFKTRNSATRLFFKGVARMPDTQMKIAALESFLQQVEAETGRKIGGRLYAHEVESWLTTEFLAEDIQENLDGIGFLVSGVVPPVLHSRDANFKAEFSKRIQCAKDAVNMVVSKHSDKPGLMRYGSKCGLNDIKGQGCGGHTTRSMVGSETVRVCEDNGLDRCCAQHDLSAVSFGVSPVSHFELCKADRDLAMCASKVNEEESMFIDANGMKESEAKSAITCLYNVMPCIKASEHWKIQVDFENKLEPVKLLKGQRQHTVSFPWEEDIKDKTPDHEVYRPSRDSEVKEAVLYNLKP